MVFSRGITDVHQQKHSNFEKILTILTRALCRALTSSGNSFELDKMLRI